LLPPWEERLGEEGAGSGRRREAPIVRKDVVRRGGRGRVLPGGSVRGEAMCRRRELG